VFLAKNKLKELHSVALKKTNQYSVDFYTERTLFTHPGFSEAEVVIVGQTSIVSEFALIAKEKKIHDSVSSTSQKEKKKRKRD